MHHLIGERDCEGIAKALFGTGDGYEGTDSTSRRYARFLHSLQPSVPPQPKFGVVLVDDPEFEDIILEAFYHESPLDDLPRYRDRTFFENGPERRPGISADVVRVDEALAKFSDHDRQFWRSFGFFVNYILCPYSRFSRGGSDSAAIGALFISRPESYSDRDLYEILVHEFSHTVMFLDELVEPHYADEQRMVHPDAYARAGISETLRPMDKVLHSLVVATEVLLHRERAIGHVDSTTIHPPTRRLLRNLGATIESIRAVDAREGLLAARGRDLVARCSAVVDALDGV